MWLSVRCSLSSRNARCSVPTQESGTVRLVASKRRFAKISSTVHATRCDASTIDGYSNPLQNLAAYRRPRRALATVPQDLRRNPAAGLSGRMLDARPGRLRALDERITRNGFGTVLVLRLVFGMAPMLNWGLGLTGVRLLHF